MKYTPEKLDLTFNLAKIAGIKIAEEKISISDLEEEDCVWVEEFKQYLYVKHVNEIICGIYKYIVVFTIMEAGQEKEITRQFTSRKTFLLM